MPRPRIDVFTFLALACLAAPAVADEIVLVDGRVLHGPTRELANGDLRITTRDGVVTVTPNQVSDRRSDGDLAEELTTLRNHPATATVDGKLVVAAKAWQYGLDELMWEELARARAQCMTDPEAERAVERFCADLEPAFSPPGARKRRPQVRIDRLLRAAAKPSTTATQRAAIEAILARSLVRDSSTLEHLQSAARRSNKPVSRVTAIRAIVQHGECMRAKQLSKQAPSTRPTKFAEANEEPSEATDDPAATAWRFAYRTAVLDQSAAVRRTAAHDARRHGRAAEAAEYLAPGLAAVALQQRTAEALGELAHPSAVPALIRAGVAAAALTEGSHRGHAASVQQTSFIRDFDVEVAAGSSIADPKVGLVQSGTVLDVTVHGSYSYRTEVIRVYRRALTRIVGHDPGNDVRRWDEWAREAPARATLDHQ